MSVLIRYLLTITSDTELATDSVSAAKVLPAEKGGGQEKHSARAVCAARNAAARMTTRSGSCSRDTTRRHGVRSTGQSAALGNEAYPNLAMAAGLAAREPAGALQAPGARGYAAGRTAGLRAWLPRVS